ncbi:MAG: SGNH/GDSL hydrolase family protein [Amylibacter sp.]|nr:SGNH/GDSL hydrolase family protein [Amylibacter sp.]
MTIISIFLIIAAALFAAAFFRVSRIISTLPKGRAEEFLESQDFANKKIIACIGDSLTHGNYGHSWVDYLREEFPNEIFLNEGINGNTAWQVLQRLNPILECKPDLIILMIGTNDALGSFNIDSGLRYKNNYNLPDVPSFEKYREHLLEIIDRIGLSPKIALCTLPPIGEKKDSLINQHVKKFNDYIEVVADEKNLNLLPVSDSLWLDINSRTYPLKSDYNPKEIAIIRRICSGLFHHYLFKMSWNDIAKSKGQWVLFDQIHLNERGAKIVFHVIKKFVSKSQS